MELRRRELFTTIRTEGAILSPDLLQRVAGGDSGLGGLKPADYHLFEGEPLNEAIVRSWNRLVGAWAAFGEARARLPEGDLGTTITRERWLLILFDELAYGRLQPARAVEIDGKSYAASHSWGDHVPIHLVGCNVSIGSKTRGVAGAAAMSPHGLVQELLNRSEERLWGFVSNGLTLRVLRDNSSLTRQAYVEFDLSSMMDGEVYADFVVLWLVCHQSRVEGDTPHQCWLERWSQEAAKQGTRALDGLRNGVEAAITALGSGFLVHPTNTHLREALRSGELDKQDYYRELLRLAYRLLFLFVAEDRGLLLDPSVSEESAARYDGFYSTRRLRRLAERRRGSKHADVYQSLRLVMEKLGDDGGCPALGLPALGGYLWSGDAVPNLSTAELSNSTLLDAVRALATLEERGVRRSVDYRNLGAEELGSVYESLLELHPDLDVDAGAFALTAAAGNERKTTGSYYTPTSLISCLLDSALDPVLDEAAAKGEQAILDLKICDPACGSGHFLVAAAHRIAKRLASARTGDDEPSPEATRTALRDVVGCCLYGVDVNPMAVELCKVSLWMEALEPGKPLSFLDAHIKCGNSLLGTTIGLIHGGIPDDAFKPLEGDDNGIAKSLRKHNKAEREGQLTLDDTTSDLVGQLEAKAFELEAAADYSVEALHDKERRFETLASSEAYRRAKLAADLWCAAFVQRKQEGAPRITTAAVWRIASGGALPNDVRGEVLSLADQFELFHWEIEYPQVFGRPGGGFDVVLGNPPWDQLQFDDREFFAASAPTIAKAKNMAARKKLIAALANTDSVLLERYMAERRHMDGVQHLIHASGRFPLTSYGRLNLAPLFAELARGLLSHDGRKGRVGLIVPTGIATDSFNQYFFRDLVDQSVLVSLFGFENEEFIFPAIHHATRFCLLTLDSTRSTHEGEFAFFLRQPQDVADETRRFRLGARDFALMNPNSRTCPIFKQRRDADLLHGIYERVPVLFDENGGDAGNAWSYRGLVMFMMNTDSILFRGEDELVAEGFLPRGNAFQRGDERFLPLYEGKMAHLFDHRFGTYAGQSQAQANQGKLPELSDAAHADPNCSVVPRYWVNETTISERLNGRPKADWLLGWRRITGATVERTIIPFVLPTVGVGDSIFLMTGQGPLELLVANLSSFVLDYVARQKLGGTNASFFIVEQLPVLPPSRYREETPWDTQESLGRWLKPRILELTHTARDTDAFAASIDCAGPPFRWDAERRALLRAEVDATFFHLYSLAEEDVDYVMETFPIVKRRDEEKHGHYRTKALILDVYRKMAEAVATGVPYETLLDPPPADPRVAHSHASGASLSPAGSDG